MASRLRVLADENMPAVEAMFGDLASVTRFSGRSLQPRDLAGVDILLVRSITRVNAELIAQADRLQFVGTATIGIDHIDRELLIQRGIPFASAPGCNAESVVDYVIAGIFHHARDVGRNPLDLSYGVIGCGNVGQRLVTRLQTLGVQVFTSDPPRAEREAGFQDTPLEMLLAQSDVVCCHTPLTQGPHATAHLLNRTNLHRLKSGALLINAGRGPVIAQADLLEVLEERPDLSTILDVWEFEPNVSLALLERCYIATPHIAGYSLDGKIRGTWMLKQSLNSRLGLGERLPLDAYLPEFAIRSVEVTDALDPLDAISMVYDLWRDDRAMRRAMKPDNPTREADFDALRKHYPLRREFSSLKLSGLSAERQKIFSALGFRVV